MNIDDIVWMIKKTADKLCISPNEVNKTLLLANNPELTDWELRKNGSLQSIINAYFPFAKDYKNIYKKNEVNKYIKYLEKELGNKQLFEEELLNKLNKNIPKLKIRSYRPKKIYKNLNREIVVVFNDTHYGLNVEDAEVGNVNQYGWSEACRRTAMVVKETCDYKLDKREQVEKLNVILNGDLIAGIIHNLTGNDMELLVNQFSGALHILGHAIGHFASNFNHVEVYGICGNHGDAPHRREGGGRVVSQKYDNYENMIYYALSAMFKDVKNVSFNFPKTPYSLIDLPAGRLMAVHGDTIFNKEIGNPGRNLNIKSLSDAIHRFSLGEISKGQKPIKMVLIGHTHVHVSFTTNDGVRVYNAPSLSGVDSYAHHLNINNNLVAQLIFETTKDFIMGDSRLIEVNSADKNIALDKIIPTYDGSLKWVKEK